MPCVVRANTAGPLVRWSGLPEQLTHRLETLPSLQRLAVPELNDVRKPCNYRRDKDLRKTLET